MDDFAQRMIERNRERRERLEKIKNCDFSPLPRKTPLSEISTNEPNCMMSKTKDMRSVERSIKADTPAIPSVRSRIVNFSSAADPDHSFDASGDSRTPRASTSSRRNRLAALAKDINSWDDELQGSPLKPQVLHDNVPVQKRRSNSASPNKRHLNVSFNKCKTSPFLNKSAETVTLKKLAEKAIGKPADTVYRSELIVEPKRNSFEEKQDEEAVEISPTTKRMSQSPIKTLSSSKVAKVGDLDQSMHIIDKPFMPVQERIKQFRETGIKGLDFVSPHDGKNEKIERKDLLKNSGPIVNRLQRLERKNCRQSLDPSDPVKQPVSSRMKIWEQKVQEEQEQQGMSPAKIQLNSQRYNSTMKSTPSMHVVSPSDISPIVPEGPQTIKQKKNMVVPVKKFIYSKYPTGKVTTELQKKLEEHLNKGWEKNDIAEKWKKEKENDLAVLEHRLETKHMEETAKLMMTPPSAEPELSTFTGPAVIPPPPPLAPSVSPFRSPLVQAKSWDHGRQAIREDFENKLRQLGFDIQSTPDGGTLASAKIKKRKKRSSYGLGKTKHAPSSSDAPGITCVTSLDCNDNSSVIIKSTHDDDDDGDHISAATPPDMSTSKLDAHAQGGSSIYSLIKKTGKSIQHKPKITVESDDSFDPAPVFNLSKDGNAMQGIASNDSESSDYYEENNSGSDSSERGSNDSGETNEDKVMELLDEAMETSYVCSESSEEKSRPVRRRRSQSFSSLQKPLESASSLWRRYEAEDVTTTDEADRYRVTWAGCLPTNEESEGPYSVDMYRASSYKPKGPEPQMKIIRQSQNISEGPSDYEADEPAFIPEVKVKQRLQELQELINQEQSVILQTSNALNKCCGVDSKFQSSSQEVECHRLLLIAAKKREAFIAESRRLRENPIEPDWNIPRGSLTISDIRIPLKQEIIQKVKQSGSGELETHYVICLIRHEGHTIVTQMVSTQDAVTCGSLDVSNLIKLSNVPQNFTYNLEIYLMNMKSTISTMTPKKKGMTPKKLFGLTPKSSARAIQSPGGPTTVRSSNFYLAGILPINLQCVGKSHFSLDKVPYSSPLQGTAYLQLRCVMEVNIELHGFLTMFEDVGGFGVWQRRWCVLKNHRLCYWKYPDEERLKEPMGQVDLKKCISEDICLIPRDVCARPNTFELICVRRVQEGEMDTLVTEIHDRMVCVRHQLSADTKEDRVIWCDKLNEALFNLRCWHNDALRPPKKPHGYMYQSSC